MTLSPIRAFSPPQPRNHVIYSSSKRNKSVDIRGGYSITDKRVSAELGERYLQHPVNYRRYKSHRSRRDYEQYGITIHYIEERWTWDETESEVFIN
jgi:hypothetical protein